MTTPAPRIHHLRRAVTGTLERLRRIEADLDDLHYLAYERQRQGDRGALVRGGERDYALDTHGDPRARAILDDIKRATAKATADLDIVLDNARQYLNVGQLNRSQKGPATTKPGELEAAIAAQRRRQARGEYVPHRTYPQPRP